MRPRWVRGKRRRHITTRKKSRTKYSIYFVGAAPVGVVKIGITDDITHRMMTLRGSSPVPLDLLLVVSGTARQEHALHSKFEFERRHGEWFTASVRLLSFIEELRASDAHGQALVLRRLRTPVLENLRRGRVRQLPLVLA